MGGVLAAVRSRWRALKARYAWLDHVVRAYAQYKQNQGDHQAAAITFFSFLSIFPLLLLAVSVLGFVLVGDPALQVRVVQKVAEQIPGGVVTPATLTKVVDNRGSTGVIGLVTLLLSGLGWVDNLRSAVESVWGHRPSSRNFLVAKGGDVVVLVLLAVTLAVSFGLTGVGTTLSGPVLRALGLGGSGVAGVAAVVVGLVVGVAWDTAAFTVVISRLPRVAVSRRAAVRGSVLAAVGFEALKTGASYYLGSIASNPAVAGFGGVVGLLIWLMLLSRYLLFCAAWTATLPGEEGASAVLAVADAAGPAAGPPLGADAGAPGRRRPAPGDPVVTPGALAGGLVGAGAVVGALGVLGTRVLRRHRRPPR